MRRKKKPVIQTGKHFGAGRIKRKRQGKKIKVYLVIFASLILLGLISYILLFTSVLKIKSFIVEGPEELDRQQLISTLQTKVSKNKTASILGADHYFAWPSQIQDPPIEFEAINIEKNIRKSELIIKTIPRKKYGLWCQNITIPNLSNPQTTCFWIDPDGIAFKEGPIVQGQLIPTIYDDVSEKKTAIGHKIAPEKTFSNLQSVLAGIKAIGLSPTNITLTKNYNEVDITLDTNTLLMFSLRFDPLKTALPSLSKLNEQGKIKTADYVDLTVENRAFIK